MSDNFCHECDGPCEGTRCECGCDTHDEHDAAEKLSRADFDRDPGVPPQWFIDACLKVRQ